MTINFRSDNETPVAAPVWAALEKANQGTAHAYAEDEWTARLDNAFSELFGTDAVAMPGEHLVGRDRVAVDIIAVDIHLAVGRMLDAIDDDQAIGRGLAD